MLQKPSVPEPEAPHSRVLLSPDSVSGKDNSLKSSVLSSLVTGRTNEKRWARMSEARP